MERLSAPLDEVSGAVRRFQTSRKGEDGGMKMPKENWSFDSLRRTYETRKFIIATAAIIILGAIIAVAAAIKVMRFFRL
jgi:hypothetical protein